MEQHQIKLIQDSFERLQNSGKDYTATFYARVFELAPAAAGLFKDDLTEQKKMLHATLAMVVGGLDNFERLESAIFDLGTRHTQYGVLPDHFPVVAEALLDTFKHSLSDFSTEEHQAWEAGLGAIASVMIKAWDSPMQNSA
ncbi:MAG: hemoglobin-like flavoprotein [Candidatus Azotimanducaceae bacterium]|jgi:hemoglobin-like flavoprotein